MCWCRGFASGWCVKLALLLLLACDAWFDSGGLWKRLNNSSCSSCSCCPWCSYPLEICRWILGFGWWKAFILALSMPLWSTARLCWCSSPGCECVESMQLSLWAACVFIGWDLVPVLALLAVLRLSSQFTYFANLPSGFTTWLHPCFTFVVFDLQGLIGWSRRAQDHDDQEIHED
jgi:hypothetical protein